MNRCVMCIVLVFLSGCHQAPRYTSWAGHVVRAKQMDGITQAVVRLTRDQNGNPIYKGPVEAFSNDTLRTGDEVNLSLADSWIATKRE